MAVVPYEQDQRLAPVTGAKQRAVEAGDGGIGRAVEGFGGQVAGYAKAKDAYEARVDEASVMELDSQFGDTIRNVESAYLSTNGRNAMDGERQTVEAWDTQAQEFLSKTSTPRQRMMMQRQLDLRRDRFRDQAGAHLTRETESWQVQTEDASVAGLARDTATAPVGSEVRNSLIMQTGARLDDIARRRGLPPEKRAELGFNIFSGIHEATVQTLRDTDPVKAKKYLTEFADQIDPEKLARLRPQVRDEANSYIARGEIEGFLSTRPSDLVEVAPAGEGEVERVAMIRPVTGGTTRGVFGEARRNHTHGGTDWAVPNRSAVVAALPGVVRYRNDPDGYGRYAVIDHGNGRETLYAHLSATSVPEGTRVAQGQAFALSGGVRGADGAGNSEGPHLHFEYRENGVKRDPEQMVGQTVETRGTGGTQQPQARQFTTLDDVIDFATERAGGDWRLRDAIIDAGTKQLQQSRAVESDNEERARRTADAWLVEHPDATVDDMPSNIVSSLDPSYRLSLTRQQQSAAEAGAQRSHEEKMLGDTLFIELQDQAATDPGSFVNRDVDSLRGMVSESQYASLRGRQREIRTGSSANRNLDLIRPELKAAVIAAGYDEDDPLYPQQLANLTEYTETWARQFTASGGEPAGLEDLRRAYRRGVTRVSVQGGEDTIAADQSVAGRRTGVVVPSDAETAIRRRLTQQGVRNPSAGQVMRLYTELNASGQLDALIAQR